MAEAKGLVTVSMPRPVGALQISASLPLDLVLSYLFLREIVIPSLSSRELKFAPHKLRHPIPGS